MTYFDLPCGKSDCRCAPVVGIYCRDHHYLNCEAIVLLKAGKKPTDDDCNCQRLEQDGEGQTELAPL